MSVSSKTLRRRFGAVCIALAILMLLAGETVLKHKLTGVTLFGYYLACFILTALAAGAAIIDAARVRGEIKEEQRSLIVDTLQPIEREQQSRKDSRK